MNAGRFTTRWARRRSSATEAELISRLRELPGPVPEPRFKSDLRAQLVAITARVVSESTAAGTTRDTSAALAGRSRPTGGGALHRLRRPMLALACASTVLVLLLGMAVWMAGGSLPGQSLYGVKRASENVQLSIAGNDTAKGEAYLQLAGNRTREVADLLSRVSPRTASLITDTLASADDDSINAMQLLGRTAVAQVSRQPLSKLSDWLPDQRSRLTEVRDRLPAGALRTRVQASMLLLQQIATRTAQLTNAMGCPCLAKALADELGPVPCTDCGPVPNPAPGGGSATLPVPIPGLGSTGTSGSLPNLSLPPLGGGSGSSSSGHAAGPPLSTGSALPAGLPVTAPPPATGSTPSGAGSGTPIVGGTPSLPLPVPLPSLPRVIGATTHIPTSLPVPSISFP